MRIIYYDLETSALVPKVGANGAAILSIGASTGASEFNAYLITRPGATIDPKSIKINGLTPEKLEELGARNAAEVLKDFADFIRPKDPEEEVVLVAHDNYRFDGRHLKNNFNLEMVEFPENVLFFDSYQVIRRVKERHGYPKYLSVKGSLEEFFNETQDEIHDALKDAKYCRRITEHGTNLLDFTNVTAFLDQNRTLLKGIQAL